jgi:heme oxygenase
MALHAATEELVGIPGAVRSIDDYCRLLRSSLAFYAAARETLRDARWTTRWESVGIDLSMYDRVSLLERDLQILGNDQSPDPLPRLDIDTFPEALGLLYVVEGSTLGGQLIGPAIVQAIGAVPITFYLGHERRHPLPWRAFLTALARYEAADVDADLDGVVLGAKRAFRAFGTTVSISRALAA